MHSIEAHPANSYCPKFDRRVMGLLLAAAILSNTIATST